MTSIYGGVPKIVELSTVEFKYVMTTDHLIEQGNTAREQNQPESALRYYAEAMTQCRDSASAFNNYGNVLRELGDPAGAVPFLQRAVQLSPTAATPNFNLAVAWLLQGNYAQGWPQYESRWQFEHLAGTLPQHSQPRWTGQALQGSTILICEEQGLGDVIQFSRFLFHVKSLGARILLQVNDNLAPLFAGSDVIDHIVGSGDAVPEFDYWTPIMSLAGVIGVTRENLPHQLSYLAPRNDLVRAWHGRLGAKQRLRVAICWSGRPDSWINRHKAMDLAAVLDLIGKNPQIEWHNLQVESNPADTAKLIRASVTCHSGLVRNFADTAALIHHMDLVISVDTAVAHLSGALGRPTWIPLNAYGTDWRWGLATDASPWYPSVRLFRQTKPGSWQEPLARIHQYLSWFKV